MLLGVFLATGAIDVPDKADQLLDLIVDALRPTAEPDGR